MIDRPAEGPRGTVFSTSGKRYCRTKRFLNTAKGGVSISEISVWQYSIFIWAPKGREGMIFGIIFDCHGGTGLARANKSQNLPPLSLAGVLLHSSRPTQRRPSNICTAAVFGVCRCCCCCYCCCRGFHPSQETTLIAP
jgi:ribosomal protein L35AE/L33A